MRDEKKCLAMRCVVQLLAIKVFLIVRKTEVDKVCLISMSATNYSITRRLVSGVFIYGTRDGLNAVVPKARLEVLQENVKE